MAGISTSIQIADRVSGALNRIIAKLYNTTAAFDAVDHASETTFNTAGVQAMTEEMYGYENRIRQLEADLVDANRRLIQMEEQTNRVTTAGNLLRSTFRMALGTISAIGGKKILNISDEFVQTTSRLNMMNNGLQTTDELVQMVYLSAQNARGSFDSMADVVSRFGNNAGDAFEDTAEIVSFANLIQKQMKIAGASQTESANAMLQLSQAIGSGVLRGDELNSIFEQAPNLIQSIADYLDVPIGQIRKMASEGEITADTVKAAVFASADDINKKFGQMPKTWGDIWQSIQNTALVKSQPVLQRLNAMANSERFETFVEKATTAVALGANVAVTVLDAIGTAGAFVYDNWSIIGPLIAGVLGIMLTYWTATKGIAIAQGVLSGEMAVFRAVQTFVSIGWGILTGNTAAASSAQFVYNSALMACPITWIIIAIIALVAVIVALANWIAKTSDVAVTGFGIISGAVAVAGAFIWNTVIGLINGIIQFAWTHFVEPWIGIIEFVLNVINGGFNTFGDMTANLIGNVISWFLSLGKVVATIIDAIFGTNWTTGLENLQSKVLAWGKSENAITLDRTAPELGGRISYGDAWSSGVAWGDGAAERLGNLTASLDTSAFDSAYTGTDAGSVADNLSSIAGDTASISDSVDISNENLKYMRDIAERDAVNRFTTAEIKVDMQNNNTISSDMDIDGVVEQLTEGVREAMEQAAEGEHE